MQLNNGKRKYRDKRKRRREDRTDNNTARKATEVKTFRHSQTSIKER